MSIEVGYGLEPYITDGFSGDTIRESIRPAFRQGQYGAGLVAGTTRIINRIAEARNVTLQDVPPTPAPAVERRSSRGRSFPVSLIVLIVLIILMSRRAAPAAALGRRRVERLE